MNARCWRGITHLVLLDTMWGTRAQRAPMWFTINPENTSGKRLHKLLAMTHMEPDFFVGNVCPTMVTHASQHGTPDPAWVIECMRAVPLDVARRAPLLVCGARARATFEPLRSHYAGPVGYFAHPAARNWTAERMKEAAATVRQLYSKRRSMP